MVLAMHVIGGMFVEALPQQSLAGEEFSTKGRREEGNKRKQRVAPPPKIAPSSGRQSAAVKEETVDPYILENFTGLCFILSFHD